MSQPYIGEIRMAGFNFAPVGWALCQGQTLPISDYEALYTLIGTTYGGNGQTTFNLPDLQCRIPFHQGINSLGQSLVIGQSAGEETVTLLTSQIPSHSHPLQANSGGGGQSSPTNGVWASSPLGQFSTEASVHSMDPNTIVPSGGNQPHENLPPFLVINFIISLFGVYPSQG